MNEKDQMRFQTLVDDSHIAKSVEYKELIEFSKKLYIDNIELTKENKHLRDKRKTFWSVTIDHYDSWDALGSWCSVWLLPLLLVGVTGFAFFLFGTNDTGQYELTYNGNQRCTYVTRVVTWGGDPIVSECFNTSEEARQFMTLLENRDVKNQKEEEVQEATGTKETTDLGRSSSVVSELSGSDQRQEEGSGQKSLQAESE